MENRDPEIDWRARADGEAHTLVEGTHYTRPANLVQRAAAMWAMRNGLRAETARAEGSVTVRFLPRREKV